MKQRITTPLLPGDSGTEEVKCSNCGNDLLVEVAPVGAAKLLKLLSVSSFTCVRCGKATHRVTNKPRLFFLCLLVTALAGLGALHLYELTVQNTPNSIRRTVNTAPAVRSHPDADASQAKGLSATQPGTTDLGHTPAAQANGTISHTVEADNSTKLSHQPQQPPTLTEAKKETSSNTSAHGGRSTVSPATDPGTKTDGHVPAPETAPANTAQTADAPASTADQPDTAPQIADSSTNATDQGYSKETASPATTSHTTAQAAPVEPNLEEVVVSAPPKAKRPRDTSTKPHASSSWTATLSGVRSSIWNGALIVSLDASGTMATPNGFTLDSPPRYVVDVPGSWTYEGERTITIDKGGAKAVRFGVYPDKLRIVLDLDHDPAEASARRTDKGLTITIR